jgi:AraC family transcriptional regulator of adaptative response/methylated-DNA-[protein]-cysteine methyltransferase
MMEQAVAATERVGRREPGSHVAKVRRICAFIEARIDEGLEGPPTLREIADHVGGSPHHLQRLFKRLMGVSPAEYADAERLKRLKSLLKDGDSVTGAMYEAGYGAASRLYERAPGQLGMTPATYARGGKGARIGYTIVDSPLGRLMVAATARGICFISLGDADAPLKQALTREFPEAGIEADEGILPEWVDAVVGYISGELPHLDLPLDIRATAFQRRVWAELMRIPRGVTRTYSEVAEALGEPQARRAVARACATNPVPLLIPCHRVVRSDGALGGYRWGLQRKQALIETEQRPARARRRA